MSASLSKTGDSPELVQAQLQAFQKQVPLLYVILLANTCALAYTHLGLAPPSLTITLPLILTLVCVLRAVQWLRPYQQLSPEQATQRLRSTVVLSGVLGALFVSWALMLFPYGDAYAQGHVAFYIGITVISCIFCLMHLRAAALLLTLVVVVPFATFSLLSGKPTFSAIALNMLLVSATMVYILVVYSRNFATMVETQTALVAKHVELEALSEENLRLAHIDSLTDLPNRRSFFARLALALERAKASGGRLAVGVVDLDGFKPINDVHGHGMGDRVLVEIGRRMASTLEGAAFVARLGGDEFGLIFEGQQSDEELLSASARLCEAIDAPIQFSGQVLRLSGSAGIATFPDAGSEGAVLFERADYALYHAKQRLRGRAVLFSSQHETAIRRFHLVQQHLACADLESEMRLVFQPIVDIETNRVIAREALARWNSPHLGSVSPDEFIRAAEHADLISSITPTLLRKGLKAAQTWPDDVILSFNLSAQDIASPEAIAVISRIVQESGVPSSRVEFEITETSLIVDYEQAICSLKSLRALGCRVSLDDFGTGHSSLSYLHKLPIDKIKIDRSFISEVECDELSRDIVKTVLLLCRARGLPCVLEGVETEGQMRVLAAMQGRYMQGRLFADPLLSDEPVARGCAEPQLRPAA